MKGYTFQRLLLSKKKRNKGKKLSSLVLGISPEDKKKLVKLPLKNHIFKHLSIKGKFTKQVHTKSLALQIVKFPDFVFTLRRRF